MTIQIGKLNIGDGYPVVIQSMTNTPTNDIEATVDQCIRIFEAGGQIIRITVQNLSEVESLGKIREQLFNKGYDFPLVADVHFNPKLAEEAAKLVEKVRINPGNYADKKLFKVFQLSDSEYQSDLENIRNKIKPLLNICKENGTAIRIGVNHGSLSDRIMNKYGDTPEGMAESAMEFIRICTEEGFRNLVISMKASNARIMVYAARLLVLKMLEEKTIFPLHLGVTEAGAGTDGRIRSAVGTSTLLQQGIGDTIRISLTEEPEEEIPVAAELVNYFSLKSRETLFKLNRDNLKTSYNKRKTNTIINIGGDQHPVVISDLQEYLKEKQNYSLGPLQNPDFIYSSLPVVTSDYPEVPAWILPFNIFERSPRINCYPGGNIDEFIQYRQKNSGPFFIFIDPQKFNKKETDVLKVYSNSIIIADSNSSPDASIYWGFFSKLETDAPGIPVIIKKNFKLSNPEKLLLRAAGETGLFFLDGMADGIWLQNENNILPLINYSFEILQSSRARISSTEFISCPSCGRTQFNIKNLLEKVKKNTGHLTGLKIAVMGCVVNGPGEMADADYGCMGAGPGKITLYRGKVPIIKNIPENEAISHLISLIKEDGKWIPPIQ